MKIEQLKKKILVYEPNVTKFPNENKSLDAFNKYVPYLKFYRNFSGCIRVEENLKLSNFSGALLLEVEKNSKILIDVDGKNSAELVFVLKNESRCDITLLLKNSPLCKISVIHTKNTKSKVLGAYKYDCETKFSYCEVSSYVFSKNATTQIDLQGISQNGNCAYVIGKIHIDEKAENSKGTQDIKGIILDSQSSIVSYPILEVNNNLVECSHSCSISTIDFATTQYFKSRGFDKKKLEKLIVENLFEAVAELYTKM